MLFFMEMARMGQCHTLRPNPSLEVSPSRRCYPAPGRKAGSKGRPERSTPSATHTSFHIMAPAIGIGGGQALPEGTAPGDVGVLSRVRRVPANALTCAGLTTLTVWAASTRCSTAWISGYIAEAPDAWIDLRKALDM